MKKALFIISSILTICIFSSCIIYDPTENTVYSESWFDRTGYVVNDENGNFKEFVEGTVNKPAGQASAVLWEHSYVSDPRCILTVQKWNSESIEYEDFFRDSFDIRSTAREYNGLIFYRDAEKVYVINNKYNDYNDKEFRDKDELRIKINISGIRNLELKMVSKSNYGNW